MKAKYLMLVNLVSRADYNAKISEIGKKATEHNDDKYLNTSEFNKPTSKNFASKLSNKAQ